MDRLLKIVRLVLPLVVALVAAALKVRAGQYGVALALAMAGGVLLGWAVVLGLESAAVLVGHLASGGAAPSARLVDLEREKELVLRSIKEVELDGALGKVDAEELARLTDPLRARALEVLRELDKARVDGRARSVEDQIEQELARRLGEKGSGTEPAGEGA
jgi:hypothetical protein